MFDLKFLKEKRIIIIAVAAIIVIASAVLIYFGLNKGLSVLNIFGISDQQIGERAIKYINDNQLSATPASLVKVSRKSGVVKITLKIGSTEFDSYATKDGNFLFPQAFDISPKKEEGGANSNTQASASVVKTDNPMLEAFVVARCPYGLQMQRAMADAVKNIPSLVQYVKVRYIGSVSGNTITAMHGEAEAKENLRQICIREEQSSKYWNYVSCDMKAGDSTGCEKSTGVDSAKLSACISNPGRGVAYAKIDFDLADKYNVSGSPTLILNETQISENDYGGRSSDGVKSMACAGFNSEPSFCSTKLNTAAAAVSFSATYSDSSSNANTDSGCAAAQ